MSTPHPLGHKGCNPLPPVYVPPYDVNPQVNPNQRLIGQELPPGRGAIPWGIRDWSLPEESCRAYDGCSSGIPDTVQVNLGDAHMKKILAWLREPQLAVPIGTFLGVGAGAFTVWIIAAVGLVLR